MDYIFGQNTVKTVGDSHSDLQGFCSIMREYPDQNITDNFTVVEKVKSDEDSEGKCYDWYTIAEHYRYVDRVKTVKQPYEETKTAYYGETEKVFYGVPQGNITVFFENDYSVSRLDGTVTIRFEAVTENKDITIMIQ